MQAAQALDRRSRQPYSSQRTAAAAVQAAQAPHRKAALPTHRNRMRTKATPSESSTPWERPKLWELEPVGGLHPSEWSENVMDHCALRAQRPIVFEPCRSVLALERSIKRNKDDYGLSSVVGGTRKHEWVAGDKVRIAIGGGAHALSLIHI